MEQISKIESRIFTIRGLQVMLDRDLAELYEAETRILKQAVNRNIIRFPAHFMFELSKEEIEKMVSQFVIPSKSYFGGSVPYVFTEQGVAMLSAVLRSDIAIRISIQIMDAFVAMRKILSTNTGIIQRLETVEIKQIETDKKVDAVLNALQKWSKKATMFSILREDFSALRADFAGLEGKVESKIAGLGTKIKQTRAEFSKQTATIGGICAAAVAIAHQPRGAARRNFYIYNMSETCKKLSLYLDTSVIGGYYDADFEVSTQILFQNIKDKRYDVFISDLTQRELLKAPDKVRNLFNDLSIEYNIIKVSTESIELAEKYLLENVVGEASKDDCIHIATATVNKIDVLVSWNFKHIVNIVRIKNYNTVNIKNGYNQLEIRSPKDEALYEQRI
ncbi:MAG: ORF6N domain-containing protein [Fibromonadales bacterium]|nr:ORF6N domain-containing protein [Fibromonadales bacterium]